MLCISSCDNQSKTVRLFISAFLCYLSILSKNRNVFHFFEKHSGLKYHFHISFNVIHTLFPSFILHSHFCTRYRARSHVVVSFKSSDVHICSVFSSADFLLMKSIVNGFYSSFEVFVFNPCYNIYLTGSLVDHSDVYLSFRQSCKELRRHT